MKKLRSARLGLLPKSFFGVGLIVTMLLPAQISFHGLTPSDALRDLVNAEASKLDHLYRDIISCRVAVERLAAHRRSGNPYRVRIELAVPGKRLIVDSHPNARGVRDNLTSIALERSAETNPQHKDPALATRDAFRKLGRQLQDYAHRQRGDIKTHETIQPEGKVTRLFDDYGFLQTNDGRDVYFHRDSLLNAEFERLTVGARVRFVEEEGEKGPQASTVRII